MKMDITTYVVVDDQGQYVSEEFDTLTEAKNAAIDYGNAAVVEFTYVLEDTELVWTPNGEDVWK